MVQPSHHPPHDDDDGPLPLEPDAPLGLLPEMVDWQKALVPEDGDDAGAPPHDALPGRVLLIDDEATLRELVTHVLVAEGWSVFEAEDADQARHLLKTQADPATGWAPFDALIIDYGLPDASGLELLHELRNAGLAVPVVFISGYMEKEARAQLADLPDVVALDKPFRPADLLRALALAVRR